MPKVLELNRSGIWVYLDENTVLPSSLIKATTRKRHTRESRIESFFEALGEDIQKYGHKSIKISTLLKHFSIGKRSTKNLETIKETLRSKGFYTQPQYSNELKLGSTIRVSTYPVEQLGELFDSEKDLEDYVEKNELYKKLKIKSVERQHRPKGTKDKLDFKGTCEGKEITVLELKNRSGGKSAVEQVLRYAGLLKQEFPDCRTRTILVTGIQNYETALAIKGMRPEQQAMFEWYLYKYHKENDYFEFKRVELPVSDSQNTCELRCPVHCMI